MLNAVISSGTRAVSKKPQIPVCYESACKALGECLSIDDAQMWDAKADALAAWAKIYHDNEAARKARALKLHAYRRMGLLSRDLTKTQPRFSTKGPVPGARAMLIGKGLKVNDADACIRLSRARADTFERAVNSPKPPAPSYFMQKVRDPDLSDIALTMKRAFVESMPFCKKHTAAAIFNEMSAHDRAKMSEALTHVYEWLDDFLMRVSKRAQS